MSNNDYYTVLWTRGPWEVVKNNPGNVFIVKDELLTFYPIRYNDNTFGYDQQHPKDVIKAFERLYNKHVI